MSRPKPISRRSFLSLSSAALAGTVTASRVTVASSVLGPGRALADGAHFDLLSVGYLDRSDSLGDLRRLPWPLLRPASSLTRPERWAQLEKGRPLAAGVVPAEQMLMGDPEMSLESVWMRIHGLHPALDANTTSRFDFAELTVLFPQEDPQFGEDVAAIPWGARGGSRPAAGMPVRFRMPLRVDGGLDLVLDVRRPGRPPERYATSFTVDPVAGLPKIQRGVYLLAFGPDAWRQPRRLASSAAIAPVRDLSLVVSFELAGD